MQRRDPPQRARGRGAGGVPFCERTSEHGERIKSDIVSRFWPPFVQSLGFDVEERGPSADGQPFVRMLPQGQVADVRSWVRYVSRAQYKP